MPVLDLTIAAFFFIMGLLLAKFSFDTRRPPLLFAAGIIWISVGILALTGLAIQTNAYTVSNLTYNGTAVQAINQTQVNTAMNQGSDFLSLSTAGLFGFVMVLLGIYFVGLSYAAQVEMGKYQESN